MSKFENRTLFYGMSLAGAGTGHVESLRSYVPRLALMHSLTPHKLLVLMCGRFPLEGFALHVHELLKHWEIQTFSAKGGQLRERLEQATGVGLSQASMEKFSDLLSPSGLMRKSDWRFCAHCLAQSEGNYSRLLWDLAPVSACPIHGTSLIAAENCSQPHLRLLPQQRVSLSTVCGVCGALKLSCVQTHAPSASEEEVQKARMVAMLLADDFEREGKASRTSLRTGLSMLVRGAFGDAPVRAALDSGLARASVRGWLLGENRPSLEGLLKLCMRSGADLSELFHGRFTQVRDPHFAKSKPRGYEHSNLDKEAVRAQLLASAASAEPRTSASFARELGIDPSLLRRLFPREVAALVEANTRLRDIRSRTLYQDTVSAYAYAAARLKEKGTTVCGKYVQREAKLPAFSLNSLRRDAMAEGIRLATTATK